jgi:hypothetical protein
MEGLKLAHSPFAEGRALVIPTATRKIGSRLNFMVVDDCSIVVLGMINESKPCVPN